MTKKHFEAAAAIVRETYISAERVISSDNRVALFNKALHTQESFVSLFLQFNPRFDATRFREACKP